MPDFFPNESQAAREVLMDQIKKMADQPVGNWVNVSGDTMTGELGVPTLAATSTASLTGPLTVTNAFTGSTMALTGAASIAGNIRFGGQVNGLGLALTSLASISSTLNVGDTLTANSGVTLNPVIIAQQTVLGGATIAPLRIIASTASQAFFDFRGAVISTASLNLAANQVAGAIQVWINGAGGPAIGYLPIFKGVV